LPVQLRRAPRPVSAVAS